MTALVSILLLGFILGMRHATDADHVVAMATIVSRQRSIRGAAFIGAAWGVGHTLAMLAAGGAIVLCGLVVPARLGLSLEFFVALMLILLGAVNLAPVLRRTREAPRQLDECADDGPDEHLLCSLAGGDGRLMAWPGLRPVCVGAVHGLAGSAAVALLVLPIIRDPSWAMGYLLVFGCGTIVGMMLITAAIALTFLCADVRSRLLHRWMGAATGLLSLGFGVFLAYEVGFVQGLFRP